MSTFGTNSTSIWDGAGASIESIIISFPSLIDDDDKDVKDKFKSATKLVQIAKTIKVIKTVCYLVPVLNSLVSIVIFLRQLRLISVGVTFPYRYEFMILIENSIGRGINRLPK